MAKSTVTVNKKRSGRPRLYEDGDGKGAPLIGVRLPPNELAAIDVWIARQKQPLSRPEAIRWLVELGLEKAKPRR